MNISASTGVRRRPAVLAVALAVAITATAATVGCGGAGATPEATPSPIPSASAATSPFTVRDPWVKAADKGMTAAFGTLVNDGDTDLTIVGVSTPVSPMEIHEMAMKDGMMVMQPKAGGLTIRAKSSHVLEPGGDHLMMLDLGGPVRAGDELTFTLSFSDGKTAQFSAVAKPFTGAEESYDPGSGMPMAPTPGMSMSPAA
ncbi:copper chaperone PCu(A)C [Plantactinospora soyae]|uniref:Copper(I)-binding protein n=1 Tax=Plantactinospora soyae TaxID=1544732 RepID=A0A927QZQ7_9ACTN|nr:copper chaperone PCu(A)C [Plantactinospora soyae]MBE1489332.1 copper(I)-binding protein [Plantactinospora soyae]